MGRSPIYSKTERAFLATGYVVTAYIAVSLIAFSFRHPWMTDTERFLHTMNPETMNTERCYAAESAIRAIVEEDARPR